MVVGGECGGDEAVGGPPDEEKRAEEDRAG